MALDFPNSPTNGQQYGGYTYDSAVGVWKANASAVAPTTMSGTAPANPTVGDQWFNTTDGTLYFYYYDGNTYQWVESRAPITADGYYSPNYIINGGFDIWQRSTNTTITATSNVYTTADRWICQATPQTTYYQGTDATGLAGIAKYSMKVHRAPGATTTSYSLIAYGMETIDAVKLAGKTVTLSFYARKGANQSGTFYADILSGTGTDEKGSGYTGQVNVGTITPTLSTSWVRYTVTGTVPANSTEVAVRFYDYWSGTAGANDYFEVAAVQLEEGAVATPFRRSASTIQGELAACQRYYTRFGPYGVATFMPTVGQIFNSSLVGFFIPMPVRMRISPTADFAAASNFSVSTATGGSTSVMTGISITNANVDSVYINGSWGTAQTLTAGNATPLTMGASAYLGFHAEL